MRTARLLSNYLLPKCLLSLAPAIFLVSFSSLSYAAALDRIAGSLNRGQNSGQTVTLIGNVHRNAQPQFDQGPVDPAMRLGTITLLTVPTAAQQSAITQLLAQQQDRRSSNYHKWLTPEQYADRFGLSPNDMRQMAAWLKAQGFTMIQPARGRNWISFTGTAAQVESAFHTEIHRYNVHGELHYANATDPVVPAALGGIITGLRGLHDFFPRPMGIRRNPELSNYARPYRARPYYDSSVLGDLVAPGDIATIYDINALYNAGFDGTGQKLAVMGQSDIYLSDITNFRTGFGLSAISCTTDSNGVITACNDPHLQYVLTGTDPGVAGNGNLSEADLDLEWSGAVARGAQLIYVNSTDTKTSYYYAIDHILAPVISLSYGECEFDDFSITNVTTGDPGPDEIELMKANTEGITFVNSSGDTGAAECDINSALSPTGLAVNGIAVSYPASSPEVTGVGGTAIPLANLSSEYWGTSTGTDGGSVLANGPQNGYIPEQAWNDDDELVQYCLEQSPGTSPYEFCLQGGSTPVNNWVALTSDAAAQNDIGISSSGGGASNCSHHSSTACINGFAQPTAWQTVSISGQTSARFSPDVSFLATPNFPGYIFCTQLSELNDGAVGSGSTCGSGGPAGITNALSLNHPSIIGGTSASAPVFAGIVTLLNQYTASTGQSNINPTLYKLAETPSNQVFHPVTIGENTVLCVGGQPSNQPPALQCPATGPSAGVIGFQASNADATTGYNLVTGLGSIDANNFAVAFAATLPSGFTFTPAATSYTVAQGSSVDATATVAMNGTIGPVTFTCTDPAPESTCTAPQAISATAGVSFHITTTAPSAASLPPSDRGMRIFYAAFLPGLLGILFTAGSRRRSSQRRSSRRRHVRGMRFLGLVAVLGFSTLWLASCGGGGSGVTSNPGTPQGTYQITMTATSGSTTSTKMLSLVVQ